MIRFEMRNISETGEQILDDQDRALKIIKEEHEKFKTYGLSNKSIIVKKLNDYFDKIVSSSEINENIPEANKAVYEYLRNKEIRLYNGEYIETRFIPSEYGVLESFIKLFEADEQFNVLVIEEYGKIYEAIYIPDDCYYLYKDNTCYGKYSDLYDIIRFILKDIKLGK